MSLGEVPSLSLEKLLGGLEVGVTVRLLLLEKITRNQVSCHPETRPRIYQLITQTLTSSYSDSFSVTPWTYCSFPSHWYHFIQGHQGEFNSRSNALDLPISDNFLTSSRVMPNQLPIPQSWFSTISQHLLVFPSLLFYLISSFRLRQPKCSKLKGSKDDRSFSHKTLEISSSFVVIGTCLLSSHINWEARRRLDWRDKV